MTKKGNKTTGKKSGAQAGKTTRLSNLVCPPGMKLEQWQTLLRQQAAQKENFSIRQETDTDESGCYRLLSPLSHRLYKIIYRGEGSPWNYCSCMDFKSNQLGTCKHIEAVKLWLEAKKLRPDTSLPPYTAVYLSYVQGRKVCIRIGSEKRDDFKRLAAEYFSKDNVLRPDCIYSFSTFLSRARKLSDTFRCYPDVYQYILDIRDSRRREKLVDEQCSDDELNHLLTVPLYPYQREGIRFAVRAGKCIIADEMGLGKTIQAIGTAELLRREKMVASVLILCPTSLKYQWKKEIERFTGAKAHVIEGGHLQRRKQYEAEEPYKIISYNSACNDVKVLGSLQTDLLIMDEAQRLKNWNTQIAKAARRIESDYTVVLSGTPLENKLQELYSIVQFVDQYRLGPYYRFTDFTTVTDADGKVTGYKNLNVVGRLLEGVLLRRRKRDVALQLPGRTDKILYVGMTKEQRVLHNEYQYVVGQIVTKWRRLHFLSEKDRNRLLLLLNQMRMVCDSTFILDQRTRHDTKVDELMQIVEEMVENGDEKMVVFSQWERMTRVICQELEKRFICYANLNGSVPSAKRKELMDEFTDNPDCRVFVSTDAGSTGLNLQVASVIVNLDLPWNPAVLEQRIARIYRIGQQRRVQVINFVAENTIEERMLSTLKFKSNVAGGILDGGEDSVFFEESKFNKLMETVEEVVLEPAAAQDDGAAQPETTPVPVEEEAEEPLAVAASETGTGTDDGQFVISFEDDNEPADVGEPTAASMPSAEEPASAGQSEADGADSIDGGRRKARRAESPQELVMQGVSFFTQLADALASPEKTAELVDTLVKEDKETGRTSIEIPVPDKESVTRMFQLFGKLMSMGK